MGHVDMFFRLVFVALAFCVAALATGRLALRAADEVPRLELSGTNDTEPLSVRQMHRIVLSMRADVAGIHVMLMFTNGLIAALLAAVIL